ncbi:MAG TPA: class D sortase [Vicinamibacterales bacterium]|nr:class D sortase [Vicinamibacterales bacterium]
MLHWAQRLLVTVGAVTLAWCALIVTDATLAQRRARHSLEVASRAAVASPSAMATPLPALPAMVRPTALRRGAAIAGLSIPRVELSAVVLHGSDTETLRRGPGHLENTALPGEPGNAVIAGHRDSFFRPLRHVEIGDDIFVDTPHARLRYRVTSLRVVDSHDLSVLQSTDDATLTLITCYPFQVFGAAPDRFVVRASLVTDVSEARTTHVPAPRHPMTMTTIEAQAARRPAVLNGPATHDDAMAVRHAVERFRRTYNARLVSHQDVRPGGPLDLQSCDVEIADNRATATCGTAPSPGGHDDSSAWTVALERTGQGWAIRSIVAD